MIATPSRTVGTLSTIGTIAALLLATSAHAQVYKCRIGGQMVFSDQPCAADAKPIDVRPASGHGAPALPPLVITTPGATQPINSSSNPQAVVARMEHARALRDMDRRIEVEHSRIREEENRMNAELAALRAKKAQANNNLKSRGMLRASSVMASGRA